VLDEAARTASMVGFRGLTIGSLADQAGLSKSGLFAHFRSKEQLQVAVLDHVAATFVDTVLRPALKVPRGEPRLRELFERKLRWDDEVDRMPGGCLFVSGATELDDEPDGPLRDRFVQHQRDWMDTVATIFAGGVSEGHFAPDADPVQFAHDLYGVMLSYHHASRLLRDPRATDRVRRAFESLLEAARADEPIPAGRA
jgi:AcrR family transcriptional regulator